MDWTSLNLSAATPEIVLLIGLFGVLLLDLWTSENNRFITHWLSIIVMLAAAGAQLAVWTSTPVVAFNGFYIADGIAQTAKMAVYLGTATLFIYAKPYNQLRGIFKGEYYTLAMFACAGMSVMISAGHFLVAYIGLELLSLSLYAMIALQRDSARAAEAALKYFVLGALASGILLYGASMIYGATGSLNFAEIFQAAQSNNVNGWLLKLGVLFIVAAVAFKFGAVPFHMWVPDVYQGAPTSVAAFIGSVPKIAATIFAFRILVSGLVLQKGDWQLLFAALAALSLLLGFVGGQIGFQAALYYAIIYALMSLTGFGVLMAVSNQHHECNQIKDLAGLNQRNAWYAFLMLLALFSMAGIPPLAGFYAKFAVLKALVAAQYPWATLLAVFAVVMSLVGAFYYLRVVRVMYFEDATQHEPMSGTLAAKWVLSANALLLLVWGVMPGHLTEWIKTAVERAL